jgi:hypothetical protein
MIKIRWIYVSVTQTLPTSLKHLGIFENASQFSGLHLQTLMSLNDKEKLSNTIRQHAKMKNTVKRQTFVT